MENILYIKTLFLCLVSFLFIGCSTTSSTIPFSSSYPKQNTSKKSNPKSKPTPTGFYKPKTINAEQKNINTTSSNLATKTPKEVVFSGSGYIKGIVEKVYFSKIKNSWIYHIRGVDTSHNKLSYAKVYASKKLAKTNDFIYAVIQNSNIISLYIFNSSKNYTFKKKRKIIKNSKQKRKVVKKIEKTPKIRKREQVINAPEVEEVTF